jgi:CO/xanthine dehydrogenase FAD-binding subunit
MARFDYVRADSLDHAIRLINDPAYKNRLLSGGTDLQVLLHYRPPAYTRVVDISLLPELKAISASGGEISLGAAVTFAEAIESDLLREAVPFLVEACQAVGSPQIRNLGTLGGNVANAAACADSLPVLVCLDAVAHLRGATGERRVPVTELVLGPNRTCIESGEILTLFTFSIPPAGTKTAFLKLGRRNALAISRLSLAAMGRLDAHDAIDLVRITPGAAVPQTVRFTQVEARLHGRQPSADLLHAAALQVAEVMISRAGWRWSSEYKSPAISSLAERTFVQIFSDGG